MTHLDIIRTWCQGSWLARHDDNFIEDICIDSRKIDQADNTLFIALKTALRDGHLFVQEAYEKGVRNFLVSSVPDTALYREATFILVKDTLVALQQIVAGYRKQFNIPVIGITGSNGKTVIKEWLYQLLSDSYNTVRSPKSFNSQIGVPLSVWLLKEYHQLAIFEAGISQPGEMENLERIIHPDIGIFTNIGEAHNEGFLNVRQKINEKLILFRYAKRLIYCRDYPELNECIIHNFHQLKDKDNTSSLQLFTWSRRYEADLQITSVVSEINRTEIIGLYKGEGKRIVIPFTDPASVENAIHCWCVMILLGVSHEHVESRMLTLQPVSMRLELRQGINDCTIINDTYNSDLTSLSIALDYLEQQKQHQHHTVILSDFFQMGRPESQLYEEVAAMIARRRVQRFIGIGPAVYKNKSYFRNYKNIRSIFFRSIADFLKNFHLLTFEKEAVLLKGARVFAFEKIGFLLEQKVHQTVLSINLSTLSHNLNVFRSLLSPGVKSMAMVKAFAYGSGSYEIASLLQYHGMDYLAVAYTDEGIGLRRAGITMPIMVMSPDGSSFDRMIAWKLEPEIFNFRSLDLFMDIAQALQVSDYPIHIKLDTGMHRLGFAAGEVNALAAMVKDNPLIRIASVFSHLAASEDPLFDDFTFRQGNLFREMSSILASQLPYKPMLHLCNSSGIARHPELHFDMVRIGLGLYGIEGSGTVDQLKQISTLKTTIAQIKMVPAGDSIGYGRKGHADSEMRIATISIGYADGYQRALGNGKAHVLVHGKAAKIIGNIAMDMCMIDVSNIPEAAEGDDVVLFGSGLTITQVAEWAGTIPYEIMTGISQRVKRIYVNED